MNVLTSILLICAALLTLAWLLAAQRRLVAYAARRFLALPRLQQVALVLTVGVMTVCAQKQVTGNKEQGTSAVAEASGSADREILMATDYTNYHGLGDGMESVAEDTGAEDGDVSGTETNVFSLTAFAVDRENCEVAFEAAWTSNLFDYTDSRNVDLFSSTNLLERRWTPLGTCAMPSDTNVCAFVVTSNDVSAAARPQFLDTFAGLGFFRFGLDIDSDGDGLTDAYESLVLFTDPLVADTDGDGLGDGRELQVGTDPFVSDTDGDGVPDGDEVAHWEMLSSDALPEFDLSGATNLLAGVRSSTSALIPVELPFPFCCGDLVHTNATVSLDGVVAFHPTTMNFPLTLTNWNLDLEAFPWFLYHTVALPYWDALYASSRTVPDAQILMADVMADDGRRYCVVEYRNVRLDATHSVDGQVSTFQVVIREGEPNAIYVRYVHLASSFDGTSATIGAQMPDGERVMQLSFDAPCEIADGTVVAYRFGLGTDPLTAEDSDQDGLPDFQEAQLGTDPGNADSDRDGMTDGWEVESGLNPTISTGDDGADGDPDGDGLSNIDEYQNDCDPMAADTDGDGVGDGVEVGRGSSPTDASDGGVAPAAEDFRELSFNINGDYAAWEMTIQGLGPDDTRTRRISMGAPNAQQNVAMKMRKGNSYRLSMRWLNSDGHTDPYCWYCWQAKIDGNPSVSSYQGYSTTRLSGNEVIVGEGWIAENAEGLLTSHVHMHDPDEDGRGGGNVAEGLTATLHVYDCDVTICKPGDESWGELEESRVVLDDEDLRIRVRITPAIKTLDFCKQALGDKIRVKTAGTCPTGVDVSLDEATFVKATGYSELRFSLSRVRVKALGLLPANDDDGENEMAWLDMATPSETSGQNLSDSLAFASLGYADRGQACWNAAQTLESSPPNSIPSESYFKAAGREIICAVYDCRESIKRQIMNQADWFYFSGHGSHATGTVQGGFTPLMAAQYWNRDLDYVIIAGCAVLDVRNFRFNSLGFLYRWKNRSWKGSCPGESWESVGVKYLLGYALKAPLDNDGGCSIAMAFVAGIQAGKGVISAWRDANDTAKGRNACVIDCSKTPHQFWYWDESSGDPVWTRKEKGIESW